MELLRMQGIQKSFFGVTVLEDVSFCVEAGEIHALLGENGAGKSTLMNILAGIYTKDRGQVWFDGQALDGCTVKETERAGIAFVHQELNVFNDLKVYENLFLGKELVTRCGRLRKKEMIRQTQELMGQLGVDISATELTEHLDTSRKQLLEIAKALHSNAKLIILDEPTTALNNEEIAKFFRIIRQLKEQGTSFIFISHKMPEIFAISDSYTVLRNGRLIQAGKIAETTPEEVTRCMVGGGSAAEELYVERELGETVLELKQVSGNAFHDVSFFLRQGEIVGLTGLQGAGCSELLRTVFGLEKKTAGKIFVHGKELRHNTIYEAMHSGVAMVAANRKENSILPDLSLLENFYISQHAITFRRQHISRGRELKKFDHYRDRLGIKSAGPDVLITSLSGGNQQKVILGRWLNTEADILLLDNPTQGIDVGSKGEIYRLILQLSQEGKTIIVNTLEIPEIQKIADRCLVFYHGTMVAELERAEINEETVMLHATNAAGVERRNGEVKHD